MIQFNLLPDVKVEYLKAQHARRVVTIVSIVVTTASLLILASVFSIHVYKTKHLESLSAEIDKASKELSAEPEVDKKLTVQNQLNSLTSLHDGKPAAPRLFNYLNQVTPNKVIGISELKVDFIGYTMTISGVSDSLTSVNKYVDTLKFTDYRVITADSESSNKPVESKKERAFSGVVLSEFTYETKDKKTGVAELPATFTISMAYVPVIFDITANVKLEVPSIITTRSSVDLPSELLKAAPDRTDSTSGGTN